MEFDCYNQALAEDGALVAPSILSSQEVHQLREIIDQGLARSSERAGARVPVCSDAVTTALGFPGVRQLAEALKADRPVRAIIFDKSADQNWSVRWHRDTTIAVCERLEIPGFGPWSEKGGVTHVRPHPSVMANMVTLRLHLDDADMANGALRAIPNSHRDVRESWPEADCGVDGRAEVILEAMAGDVLVMKPLTLHRSKKSSNPSRRRVLHIEFSADELPGGLKWYSRG